MERALRVCTTCKSRKKSCDKALPRCGYCTQRGLLCLYEDASGSTPPTGKSPWVTGAATLFSLPSKSFLHCSPSDPPLALDCALHLQVLHVFHLTEQSFSTVCDQYFRNFHLWLPVISPNILYETNSTHQDGYPPVDFSLLVLAMYLVTLQPADDNAHQIVSPQDLYLELKMLMARAQATIYASTRLIQTGLLLASFEYACGKPHAAYVSIGTCAGMASIVGIHYETSQKGAFTYKSDLDLQMVEGRNIYWGMIVLERLTLHECPSENLRPALHLPDQETELPSDLIWDNSSLPQSFQGSAQAPLVSDIHSRNVSGFGRQVQAIYLLVQVEEITTSMDQVKFTNIRKLDEKLRGFLSILMDHSVEGHRCGANGIVIRSLVRLHQYTLNQNVATSSPQKDSSHAALDTLVRMMVDVARDHLGRFVPDRIDSLPLSCSYNIRSMMELIENGWGHINQKERPEGLEAILTLYQVVCKRWTSTLET